MDIHEILMDAHTWVAVGFLLFLAIAAKYVFPVMGKQLDARADKVRSEIEEAAKLKEEAKALFNEAQKKLQEADQSAHEIIERARFESKQIADEAEKEIEAEMERKMKLAEEKIARAESNALDSVRTHAVQSAVEAARDIITRELIGSRGADYTKKSAELISKKIA